MTDTIANDAAGMYTFPNHGRITWSLSHTRPAYGHYFPARTKPAVPIDTLISSEIYRLLFVLSLLVQVPMLEELLVNSTTANGCVDV